MFTRSSTAVRAAAPASCGGRLAPCSISLQNHRQLQPCRSGHTAGEAGSGLITHHAISVQSKPAPSVVMGAKQWPKWECEVKKFPWTYEDTEMCLVIQGKVTVTPDGGEPVQFGAGDFVMLPAGLSCTWDVHEPVIKHYSFEK